MQSKETGRSARYKNEYVKKTDSLMAWPEYRELHKLN